MQQQSISFGRTGRLNRHSFGVRARAMLLHVGKMLEVARERRCLAELDDRMLEDIGLSRSVACREVERPWFDVPLSRRDYDL